MADFRVVSWNVRAYFGSTTADGLAKLIRSSKPSILLLQECRPRRFREVCELAGLTGRHSHEVAGDGLNPRRDFPPDGVGIAAAPGVKLSGFRRIGPKNFEPAVVASQVDELTPKGAEALPERLANRFSARSLTANARIANRRFTVGSFHATPGTGSVGGRDVGEFKPFFHGAVAVHLARRRGPFLFGIDANEPYSETAESIEFHWEAGRPGSLKMEALLGLDPRHRARDLLRQRLEAGGRARSTKYLELTHEVPSGGRRFDSIWATPDFTLNGFRTTYKPALKAGSDHALLAADLTIAT